MYAAEAPSVKRAALAAASGRVAALLAAAERAASRDSSCSSRAVSPVWYRCTYSSTVSTDAAEAERRARDLSSSLVVSTTTSALSATVDA
jgi:hypothetical protein